MSESLLNGFEIVASDGVPAITLDNQRRFYLNSNARSLTGVSPYERLAIDCNPTVSRLAIVKPTAGLGAKEASEFATSNYAVDKRYYMSARHFARTYAFEPSEAPFTFVYDRGSSG